MTRVELQRASELGDRIGVIDRIVSALRREAVEKIEVTLANAEDDSLIDPNDGLVIEGDAVRAWLEGQRTQCVGELDKLGVTVE